MNPLQPIIVATCLLISAEALATKTVFYADETLTIYSDNSIVYADKSAGVFAPSKTWVEADFFTQQAKYCEVDVAYSAQLNAALAAEKSQ